MTLPRDFDHDRVLSRSLVAASGENVHVSRSALEQEIVVAGFWARQVGREETIRNESIPNNGH
jgi:hypothetical protein